MSVAQAEQKDAQTSSGEVLESPDVNRVVDVMENEETCPDTNAELSKGVDRANVTSGFLSLQYRP